MDAISAALLTSMAGGLGGEAGRQAWASLCLMVRRPFTRPEGSGPVRSISSGERELADLAHAPQDVGLAQALSTVLAARAGLDPGFREALDHWAQQAERIRLEVGEVHSEISGGHFHGPVVQVGAVTGGLTFAAPSPLSPPPERRAEACDDGADGN